MAANFGTELDFMLTFLIIQKHAFKAMAVQVLKKV